MNLFREHIAQGRISSESELKRLFRILALKLHPDTCLDQNTAERFLALKRDYDEALRERGWETARAETKSPESFSFDLCADLFGELVAGNFPAAPKVKAANKMYRARLERLNAEIGVLGGDWVDMFKRVEQEMLVLRGDSVVSNHAFNLVKIYFCNLYDSIFLKHPFSKAYVRNSYGLVAGVLRESGCAETVRFIDLMLRGV